MWTVFQGNTTDAALLVDASNAFNNFYRQVALHNIHFVCPGTSILLINCYRSHSSLFVGGVEMFSQEGTTQGDPLAMAMVGLATAPLIRKIATPNATEAWFADDAGCGGSLKQSAKMMGSPLQHWTSIWYFPNAIKKFLVVKPDKEDKAQSLFAGTGVALNASGKRYLGGAPRQASFEEDFLREKVEDFVSRIKILASIAKTQPQAAYAAFTFGEISRWTYSLRVSTITSDELFEPLEEAVTKHLIPVLTNQHSPGMEVCSLLALPSRLGAMGIINPTEVRSKYQRASLEVCAPLVKNILDQKGDPLTCQSLQASTKARLMREKRAEKTAAADNIICTLPGSTAAICQSQSWVWSHRVAMAVCDIPWETRLCSTQ